MLSAEAQVALGQQCRLVKKSADHLKLRHDNMFRVARDRMAQLKRDMCVPFVTLGEACKADCAGKDSSNLRACLLCATLLLASCLVGYQHRHSSA